MNVQFNTHTYILYIHTYIQTIAVIIKNDKNKIHTFYKVLLSHHLMIDIMTFTLKMVEFGMHINTNAP